MNIEFGSAIISLIENQLIEKRKFHYLLSGSSYKKYENLHCCSFLVAGFYACTSAKKEKIDTEEALSHVEKIKAYIQVTANFYR